MDISSLLSRASACAVVALRSYKKGRFTSARRLAAVRWAASTAVEALESRTLLSSVSGTVYNDLNLSGARASGDAGLAGAFVYDDVAGTGQFQSGDPSATTASDGTYTLTDVPLNSVQTIRAVPPSGWQESTVGGAATNVEVTDDAPDQTGVDFGQWQPITSVTESDITVNEGQTPSGTVATVSSSAGLSANPSYYSGSLTLNGVTYGLSFAGNTGGTITVQVGPLPTLLGGN